MSSNDEGLQVLLFHEQQGEEWEAWQCVVAELKAAGAGDINAGGTNEPLHDAICAWAEELVKLRLYDPDPKHAVKAWEQRRTKYLGSDEASYSDKHEMPGRS